MAIHIVTDSTADLPVKLVAENRIGIVSLNVHFGEEVLKDGVDIWSDEFYHRLNNEQLLPNTSQPAPGEFINVYRSIAQPGDTIISIHLSADFSGTVGSAKVASEMLEDQFRVIVVDSRSVTMGLGWMALKAAQMAAKGSGVEEILAMVENIKREIVVHFTVTSLEHLQRTGRIGKDSAYLGSLLNIKPLLTLRDGMIVPLEKMRGNNQKVAERMVEDLKSRFGERPLLISIVRGELDDLGAALEKNAQAHLKVIESIPSIAGPIVGTHTGPKMAGIVVIPEQ